MKIAGITKVRNEAVLIQDTLDHYSGFCNAGLYVLDECSTDGTREIAHRHQAVRHLYELGHYDEVRMRAETRNRKLILDVCKKDSPDWIVVFDADERIEGFPSEEKLAGFDAVKMRFFDIYITAEDVDNGYLDRKWMGPEYRDIVNMVRNTPYVDFVHPDQRPPCFRGKVLQSGFVKHYGKAVSVDEWEATCDYYATWPEPYKSKWNGRRGKAVHSKSDFGRDLIIWGDKEVKGVPL